VAHDRGEVAIRDRGEIDRASWIVRAAERVDVDRGVRDAGGGEQIGQLADHRRLARAHRSGNDQRLQGHRGRVMRGPYFLTSSSRLFNRTGSLA
jgi:hypothetical protein